MYCAFDGKFVTVRNDSGSLVRKFIMNTPVVGAQVSGENVIIQCEGGWTYVYKTSGSRGRKSKY